LEAVGQKFSHRPGNHATVGVVRWPSAGDTAGYGLRRPKLTPVSLISMVLPHAVVNTNLCLDVLCVSLSLANTDEPIKMTLGGPSLVRPSNHELNGGVHTGAT